MPGFSIFMNNYSKTTIFLSKAFIIFLVVFSVYQSSPASANEITPKNIIKLVNKSRENNKVAPLIESDKLARIARDKINDMIEKDYFAHTSPSGITPWYWYEKEGYDYKYAGENLAINFLTSEEQHKAWMESTTHRKNILNPSFQEIGVAVAAGEINGESAIIAVQEFGTLLSGPIPVDKSKNFSGKEKTNIVEEGVKITPQVLSSKEVNEKSSDDSSSRNNYIPSWENNALEIFQVISILAIMIALLLTPVAFLAMATNKLLIMMEDDKKIAHVK